MRHRHQHLYAHACKCCDAYVSTLRELDYIGFTRSCWTLFTHLRGGGPPLSVPLPHAPARTHITRNYRPEPSSVACCPMTRVTSRDLCRAHKYYLIVFSPCSGAVVEALLASACQSVQSSVDLHTNRTFGHTHARTHAAHMQHTTVFVCSRRIIILQYIYYVQYVHYVNVKMPRISHLCQTDWWLW